MPERLAVPQRENLRQPKSQDLELLSLLRRPALTFLEEEEGDRGNSIIITVTGEPRVNPRSFFLTYLFTFVITSFMSESQGKDNNTRSSTTNNNSAISPKSCATADEEESEAEAEDWHRAIKG